MIVIQSLKIQSLKINERDRRLLTTTIEALSRSNPKTEQLTRISKYYRVIIRIIEPK